MNEQQRGIAIDEAGLPDWARTHFSAAQLTLNAALLWVLLIYMSTTLESSRLNIAQRLYVHTVGKNRKEASPSQESLARDLNLSPQTVSVALDDLEHQGWIIVRRRSTHFNVYRLAWPTADVLSDRKEDVATCGRLTKKGEACGRRAGWGTDTPGSGPCKLHPDPEPEPTLEDSSGLQRLESTEPDSTPTVGNFNSNRWSNELQRLELNTPTVGVEYVGALRSSFQSSSSGVLSEGQLTDRNARETPAPPAQPKDHSFPARSLIAGIERYRNAPGWARKHLVALTATALEAGLGRDAITHYAAMAITEARYAEHQHIPELRAALARLGRDVALGHACATCARDPGGSFCCATDRPWTDDDQAALEAALDHLGVTPDDLDTGTS
ncbi:hypothetical protein ACFFMN_33790 [Planobispora siamensis]|uniref:MarR family protein n=1 Tax=Planobispora siamensis TaxID=936338 RepID=A0A8J3SC70_9ACTN|nr:MarR family transcriptional regulator [Planobispora siamensis]GIH91976.1 hypothetical protein Psi01_26060 [Planobispora siamensis]